MKSTISVALRIEVFSILLLAKSLSNSQQFHLAYEYLGRIAHYSTLQSLLKSQEQYSKAGLCSSVGTNTDSEQKDEDSSVSQHSSKPHFVRSAFHQFYLLTSFPIAVIVQIS